jgi:hypothetical protein
VVPLFNVVIMVDNGNITDVLWDNDCFSCLTDATCITTLLPYNNDTNLIKTEKNCKSTEFCTNNSEGLVCDPKFYITWFGTDANGKQLKSSNLSMSRFRQYAVGSLYNSAKDAFNKTVDTLKNTWSSIESTANKVINDTKTGLHIS